MSQSTIASSTLTRVLAAAERYIASDRSDPFTRARVLNMIAQGHWLDERDGAPIFDADSHQEEVTLDNGATFSTGTNTFHREAFRNIRRT